MIDIEEKTLIVAEVERTVINDFFTRADDRYMTKDSCDKKNDDVYKSMAAMEKSMAQMRVDNAKQCVYLKVVVGILSAIGVALIPICLKLLLGG